MAALMRRLAQNPSSFLKILSISRSISPENPQSRVIRSYLAESTPSAFDENLLRIIRSEISYLSEYSPPLKPLQRFKSFTIQDNPGEQYIRLKSTVNNSEEIKIDATLFDGVADPNPNSNLNPKMHISMIVEVSRNGSVFGFICSAWPDMLVVQKVMVLNQSGIIVKPYLGPDLSDLNDEAMKRSIRDFLEKRGVNDEMAVFLHKYMLNKDKAELVRWLKTIESYVEN